MRRDQLYFCWEPGLRRRDDEETKQPSCRVLVDAVQVEKGLKSHDLQENYQSAPTLLPGTTGLPQSPCVQNTTRHSLCLN